jgi:hypothetical protein
MVSITEQDAKETGRAKRVFIFLDTRVVSSWRVYANAEPGNCSMAYLLLCGVPVLVGILERRLRMAAVIIVGIVLAMAIPLFGIWNGLVPPDSQDLVLLEVSLPHGPLSLG